jgi:DNA-binding transcriptional MocR family regulator
MRQGIAPNLIAINECIVTMTIWTPRLSRNTPAYQALADAIANAVESGELEPGARLPPQRELADALGVTLATVTRGYALASRLGLILGEVGRGTYVRGAPGKRTPLGAEGDPTSSVIDLSTNLPTAADDPSLPALLHSLLEQSGPDSLLRYHSARSSLRHRLAAAEWLSRFNLETNEDEVLPCAGGQHALYLCLSHLCEPGSTVLAEALTYPGFIAAAQTLHLNVHGIPQDTSGATPEGLRAAVKRTRARVAYLTPTCQNPTTGTATLARRKALIAVAEELDCQIIEDDLFSPLFEPRPSEPKPTPLAQLAPERVYFIGSLGKIMAGGLRVAFLRPPAAALARMANRLQAVGWMIAPLNLELAKILIESGQADKVLDRRRRSLAQRIELARERLPRHALAVAPSCYHAWLTLPEPWQGDAFAAELAQRGVLVRAASTFYVGRGAPPRAVRFSLSAAPDLPSLQAALQRIAAVLSRGAPEVTL